MKEKTQKIVVTKEIYGDRLTPISVFENLAQGREEALLLDSSDYDHADEACIYMGFDPIAEFEASDKHIIIKDEKIKEYVCDDPFAELRQFFHQYRCDAERSLAKFAGGMVGFISYDAVRYIEKISDRHQNADQIPNIRFKFYGTHVVFDKRTGKVTIAKIMNVGEDENQALAAGMKAIDHIIEQLLNNQKNILVSLINKVETQNRSWITDTTEDRFIELVEQAKRYIQQGEIFQVVLSRTFSKNFTGNDFDIYRALRLKNPSPYQFYLKYKDFTVVGSSPEKLVSFRNSILEVTPIAGTRKRGQDEAEDLELANDLLNDPKELSEHMMLVDLGRNDVGSIAEPGSVQVTELSKIQRFSQVMHLVSRVQGKLKPEKDAIDVLKAVFPAGTLSGAPKIRAMEIIDELESKRRGIYGGAICAVDDQGNLDSCITIRTALLKEGKVTIRAGAGVVLDSQGLSEANETYRKAKAVMHAIDLAEEGFI